VKNVTEGWVYARPEGQGACKNFNRKLSYTAAAASGYLAPDTFLLKSLILSLALSAALSARFVCFTACVIVVPVELSTPMFFMTKIPIINDAMVKPMSNAPRMTILLLILIISHRTVVIIAQS
jgi:hypothetical protein